MSTPRDEPPFASWQPTQRSPAAARWEDLALAAPEAARLREAAAGARAPAPGLVALFSGPRGTGKTLAAEVLARELGLELHCIDLAAVVAKYLGETERHLDETFDAAEAGGALLLFDEADALFGARSAVAEAHDRHARSAASHLLRRIEGFGGVVILASAAPSDLDPALLGLVRHRVELPRPEAPAIAGVATSITAFVGRTAAGPVEVPTVVSSFAEFERGYGGLSSDSPLSYAVRQYFDNGGATAVIARVVHRDASGAEDPTAPITDSDLADPALAPLRRGLWQLDEIDLLNLLVIPPLGPGADVGAATWDAAIRYARSRRAFVLVDPPAGWTTAAAAIDGLSGWVARAPDAALYFPRILAADPAAASESAPFAPSGAIAGIYARTDAERGVWKAPAGPDATLLGVLGLTAAISQEEAGRLNLQAVNSLRTLPPGGAVVWGARTLAGAGGGSDWRYVPVRRLALFVEESLSRGTRWALFEPNGAPLWARLRRSAGAFLDALWRQGALQGTRPEEAYFVRCDAETTSESDLERGLVHLLVGIAPVRPAEFLLLRLTSRTASPGR